MPGMNGKDAVVLVENPSGSGTFQVVGSQRGATFDQTATAINVASKDDDFERFEPGRVGSTLSLSALYVPTHEQLNLLREAQRSRSKVKVRLRLEGDDFEEATAVITRVSVPFPDNAEVEASVDLQIDGPWTVVV